jgi:hypothetical protein
MTATMRLALLLAPLVVTLASCSSTSDDTTAPAGVEKRPRLEANGNTVVASWEWTPAHPWTLALAPEEIRYRVSRDGGRTFGPVHTLGAFTSSATVVVSPSGRIAFFYRRITNPENVLEGTVATAIEATFVEPAGDAPSTPVTVERGTLPIPDTVGVPLGIVVSDRPGGDFALLHWVPSRDGRQLHVLTSSADGATWTLVDSGKAFEIPTSGLGGPLFVRCRGTSQRRFFVMTDFLGSSVAVRVEADDGRWPFDRAIDVVGPDPGLPTPSDGAIDDCVIDGDRIWLLFDAWGGTPKELGMWAISVNLSDGKVDAPMELPGSQHMLPRYDARLFAEGGRLFAAATVSADDTSCNLVTWSGAGTLPNRRPP